MTFKPHGIVVPIVTPVTQDGKFNEKAYRDLIEYLASSGIHGVFPFGTTGEFYAHDMKNTACLDADKVVDGLIQKYCK